MVATGDHARRARLGVHSRIAYAKVLPKEKMQRDSKSSSAAILLRQSRRMRLTVAGDSRSSAAICWPVRRPANQLHLLDNGLRCWSVKPTGSRTAITRSCQGLHGDNDQPIYERRAGRRLRSGNGLRLLPGLDLSARDGHSGRMEISLSATHEITAALAWSRRILYLYAMVRTMPPSTRSAAPLVADASFELT